MQISVKAADNRPISDEILVESLQKSIEGRKLTKVLLLPPDLTRLHSYAGKITAAILQYAERYMPGGHNARARDPRAHDRGRMP
ncbi:MAG: hypothetical protein ACOX4T_06650 [Acetivibrionales bacterium]